MQKINLMAPINSLGYGVASKNICKSLSEIADVSLFPIGGSIAVESEEERSFFGGLSDKAVKGFDKNAPCLKIWHEFMMAERVGHGRYFGLPFFEVDRLSDRKSHSLFTCDEVIVPSEWARQVVSQALPETATHVVPLGVDRELFNEKDFLISEHRCSFFNCGKWEVRKGHDILIHLFQSAFPNDEPVELWMMCDNPFLSPEEQSSWHELYKRDPRIHIISRAPRQAQVSEVMRRATCGIFPSRAEGWNMELLEMMSIGKPVIATEYSAHTEFCNDHNARLVKPARTEPIRPSQFTADECGEQWACLDEGAAKGFISHMQNVYNLWKEKKVLDLTNTAGIETARKLTWESTANNILEIINNAD